jgi:DMSO/TMAO reductase YedYZ molybdopterin-dependent catalytic subunit
MKPSAVFVLLFCLTCITILSCCAGSLIEDIDKHPVDGIAMATPKGEKLKSAENGPERSVLGRPRVDLDNFQLFISGLVHSPFSLTLAEIQKMPPFYTGKMVMYCIEGWEVWGNWKGILVKDLLKRASLKDNALYVMFHCADGYSTTLPIAYLEKYDAMLAYEVNGKTLRAEDGLPLRLIAFGKYGYKWAKWVNRIQVLDRTRKGYWEQRGYSDRANVRRGKRRHYEGADAEPLEY